MSILSRLKLLILEERLKLGAFGKYNRYRCWCLERNVTSVAEKIRLAREVLSGPGVSLAESQHNVEYIRRHACATQEAPRRQRQDAPTVQGTPPPEGPAPTSTGQKSETQ
jgi:hypothetical protein